jgi:hypothetical protein
MPVRFDAWSAATWTALWTRPWSKHSGGDRVRGRSLRRSAGGLVQEEVKRLAGIATIFPPATVLGGCSKPDAGYLVMWGGVTKSAAGYHPDPHLGCGALQKRLQC